VTDAASRTGWTRFVSGQDITSDGHILGWGIYQDQAYSGLATFVLAPTISMVPEPAAAGLLLAGLLALAALCRREGSAHTK
jgi:hypothetical protein